MCLDAARPRTDQVLQGIVIEPMKCEGLSCSMPRQWNRKRERQKKGKFCTPLLDIQAGGVELVHVVHVTPVIEIFLGLAWATLGRARGHDGR